MGDIIAFPTRVAPVVAATRCAAGTAHVWLYRPIRVGDRCLCGRRVLDEAGRLAAVYTALDADAPCGDVSMM